MSFQDTSKFKAGFADDACLCGWPDLPGRCPGPDNCPMHGQNEPPEEPCANSYPNDCCPTAESCLQNLQRKAASAAVKPEFGDPGNDGAGTDYEGIHTNRKVAK